MHKLVLLLACIMQAFCLIAQEADTTSGATEYGLRGSINVDYYARYDKSRTATLFSQSMLANQVGLGWVNARLAGDWSFGGFNADIVIGDRATEWYGEDGTEVNMPFFEQANVYFNTGEKSFVSAGIFNYWFNYEWNEPLDNPNYSCSYTNSSLAAAWQGVTYNYEPNDTWSFVGGVFMTPDQVGLPKDGETNSLFPALQVNFAADSFAFSINTSAGQTPDQGMVAAEIYGDWDISDHFRLGWDLYHTSLSEENRTGLHQTGLALYPQWRINDKCQLNWRPEFYLDAYSTDEANQIISNTLTFKYMPNDWLTLQPEARYDMSNQDYFESYDRIKSPASLQYLKSNWWVGIGASFHLGEVNDL
jgi:Putative beta-barrel porin-2, OmpL-like. bbp2